MSDNNRPIKKLSGEISLDILDLAKEYVRKLWLIILSAVIVGVLISIVKYVKDINQYEEKAGTTSLEDIMSVKENEIAVNSYILSAETLESMRNNLTDSTILNVDAYNIDSVNIQYLIKSDSTQNMTDLSVAFGNYVNNGGLVVDMAKTEKDTDLIYLQEIVNCSSTNYDSSVATGIINISVYGSDEEDCKKRGKQVAQLLKEFSDKLKAQGLIHELKELDYVQTVIARADVYEKQLEAKNNFDLAQQDVEAAYNKLSDIQKIAVKKIMEGDDSDTINLDINVYFDKKYLIIGCIIGAFLMLVAITVVYFLDGKLKTEDEVETRTGIRYIGTYKNEKDEEILYSQINAIANANNLSKISKKNLSGVEVMSKIDNLTSLDFDAVLLVLKTRKTKLKDIDMQISYVSDINKKIIGYIIVE